MNCEESVHKLVVRDPMAKAKEFEVRYRPKDKNVECSCKLFERIGIPCSHGFLALKQGNVCKLPKQLVLNCWSKNAEMKVSSLFAGNVSTECSSMERSRAKVNYIFFDFNTCMGLAGQKEEDMEYAGSVIKDLKHKLRSRRGTNVTTSKKDIIQNFTGAEIPEDIIIKLPNESKNKGCGKKRIVGLVEKAIVQNEKLKRLCRACNEMTNHDKRNCPSLNKGRD